MSFVSETGLFYAAAIPAVILAGLAKGGFSGLVLLGMGILSLAISPVRGAAIMLPILILQDVITLWTYRKSYDGAALRVLLPGALAGTALAFVFAAYVPDALVRLVVGVISVLFAASHFAGSLKRLSETALARGASAGFVWGVVSGFTSFISHAGGPPVQIWLMPRGLDRFMLAGTFAWFFAVTNLAKVPAYLWLGQLNAHNLRTSLVFAPLAVASTFAGVWLVRRTPEKHFYRIIYALLMAVGVKLAFEGWSGLWG